MEVKKKFEKPQMEVVQLKPANMVCATGGAGCPDDSCSFHQEDCFWDGDQPEP